MDNEPEKESRIMIGMTTAAAFFKRAITAFPTPSNVSVGIPAAPSAPTKQPEDSALVHAIREQLAHTRYLPPGAVSNLDIALAVEKALADESFEVFSNAIERKWAVDTIKELHALRTAGDSVEDASSYADDLLMDFLAGIGHEDVGKAWWYLDAYVIEHNEKAGINPAPKVQQ